MWNARVPALFLACIGLCTSLLAAVALLVGLGERNFIVSGMNNEKLFTLGCVLLFLDVIAKIASDLLLVLGAYSNNAGEMFAGLILNKVTVILLSFGGMVCALLRFDIALPAALCGGLLIALYAIIWLCAFKAYRQMQDREKDDLQLVVDDVDYAIHI